MRILQVAILLLFNYLDSLPKLYYIYNTLVLLWQSIMTLRKLKTTMPSLKPPVNKMIRSGVVYQISCSRCTACYVGQTSRHLQTRIREHTKNQGPVKTHLHQCKTTITEEHIDILSSTSRGESHLLTLEALYIQELDPKINTKDEYRSRTLTMRI